MSKLYINSTVQTAQRGKEKFVYLFVSYRKQNASRQRFWQSWLKMFNAFVIGNFKETNPKPIKSNWITCWTNSLWFRLHRIHFGYVGKVENAAFSVRASKSVYIRSNHWIYWKQIKMMLLLLVLVRLILPSIQLDIAAMNAHQSILFNKIRAQVTLLKPANEKKVFVIFMTSSKLKGASKSRWNYGKTEREQMIIHQTSGIIDPKSRLIITNGQRKSQCHRAKCVTTTCYECARRNGDACSFYWAELYFNESIWDRNHFRLLLTCLWSLVFSLLSISLLYCLVELVTSPYVETYRTYFICLVRRLLAPTNLPSGQKPVDCFLCV